MATPITIDIPHQLGRAEARRRIEDGFTKMLTQLPGIGGTCSESWNGDRLTFNVAAMGQTVAGTVDVGDAKVSMQIELTGVLGMIASRIKGRLQKAGQLLLTKK
jgi:putative polyhydroxyalkanoate system protein